MITQEAFYGGAKHIAPASDTLIHPGVARVWHVAAAGGAGVTLPDARTVRGSGAPMLVIVNVGAGALPIKNISGVAVVSPDLPAGQSCLVSLIDNSTADGLWGTQYKVHSIA